MRGLLLCSLGLAACVRGPGGLDPRLEPPVGAAALGWSLGGEVHVFIADDSFAQRTYRHGTTRVSGRPADVRVALDQRPNGIVTLPGPQLEERPLDRPMSTASILSRGRLARGDLTLIRIHAGRTCAQLRLVTELVYRLNGDQERFAPPAQSPVVALFGAAPGVGVTERLPAAPAPGTRNDILAAAARRAARATSRTSRDEETPLAATLAADPDRAADAGELLPVAGPDPDRRYAVAIRARVLEPGGDTVLVTGVALSDSAAVGLRWVMRPLRFRLKGGLAQAGAGPGPVRYALRGTAFHPGSGELLLVGVVDDAAPDASRILAVDTRRGRVIAAQPLALRCR
jgi:hypothetical protein